MSNIEVVKVIPPELNLNNKRVYGAVRGAKVISYQTFPCPNPTVSGIQVTMTPPSQDIAISREVLKKVVFTCSVSGTNTSGSPTLLQSGYIGPRCFPLLSVTNSESITINNATITQSPMNQYMPATLWYSNSFDNRFERYSLAPSTLDKAQSYSDLAGSNLNPLLSYQSSSYEIGRGSSAYFEILTNGPTSATIRITTCEPVMLSPFCFGEEQNSGGCPGLIGVNNMTYYAVLGNINRVVSQILDQGIPGIIISNLNTTVSSYVLQLKYLTPDPQQPLPKNSVFPYFSLTDYPTQSSQVFNPGNSFNIPMSSIQLNGVPRRIILFATHNPTTLAADTLGLLSDAYLTLADNAPLTITFNNNQFYSSATREEIFLDCVGNGYNGTWQMWSRDVGSVIVLEFGKNIGLDEGMAPGMEGNYQLQISANFTNTSTGVVYSQPTLHCVVDYEGIFSIDNGFVSSNINILNKSQVMNAQPVQGVNYQRPLSIYGGDFFSGINDFLKRSKILSSAAEFLPGPLGRIASKSIANYGYGKAGSRRGGAAKKPRAANRPLRSRIRGAGLYNEPESESEEEQYQQEQYEQEQGHDGYSSDEYSD